MLALFGLNVPANAESEASQGLMLSLNLRVTIV